MQLFGTALPYAASIKNVNAIAGVYLLNSCATMRGTWLFVFLTLIMALCAVIPRDREKEQP